MSKRPGHRMNRKQRVLERRIKQVDCEREHSLAAVRAAGTGRKIITTISSAMERAVTVLRDRRTWITIARRRGHTQKTLRSHSLQSTGNLTACQNTATHPANNTWTMREGRKAGRYRRMARITTLSSIPKMGITDIYNANKRCKRGKNVTVTSAKYSRSSTVATITKCP